MIDAVLGTLILACVGVAFEVVFTALANFRENRNWRLMGQSYIWMFPIYALLYPAFHFLYPFFECWAFVPRGLLSVAILFVVEYISGWILRKIMSPKLI